MQRNHRINQGGYERITKPDFNNIGATMTFNFDLPTVPYDEIQIQLQDNEVRVSFMREHREIVNLTHLFLPNDALRIPATGKLRLPTD